MPVQITRSRAGRHSLSLGHCQGQTKIRRTTVSMAFETPPAISGILPAEATAVYAITASAPISIASRAAKPDGRYQRR